MAGMDITGDDDDGETILDRLSEHTGQTRIAHYAVPHNILEMPDRELQMFARASDRSNAFFLHDKTWIHSDSIPHNLGVQLQNMSAELAALRQEVRELKEQKTQEQDNLADKVGSSIFDRLAPLLGRPTLAAQPPTIAAAAPITAPATQPLVPLRPRPKYHLTLTQALQQYRKDKTATFKSTAQERATRYVRDRQHHTLIVMGTGAGKTLTAYLPISQYVVIFCRVFSCRSCRVRYEPKVTSIVLVPYLSLLHDLRNRAASDGIRVVVWGHTPLSDDTIRMAQIILVTLESFENPRFIHQVLTMRGEEQLARLLVDEAHVSMIAEYRPKARDVCLRLIGLQVPIVLLTATLPPSRMPELLRTYALEGQHLNIVRTSTQTPHIHWGIHEVPDLSIEKIIDLVPALASRYLPPGDRMIVYCDRIANTYLIRDKFDCSIYHGDLSVEQRESEYAKFASGRTSLMAATTALSSGIDMSRIRLIVIHNPENAFDVIQSGGRARQEDTNAHVIMLVTPNYRPWPRPREIGRSEMIDFFTKSGQGCLRSHLFSIMDGPDDPLVKQTCKQLGYATCSNCEKLGMFRLLTLDCSNFSFKLLILWCRLLV